MIIALFGLIELSTFKALSQQFWRHCRSRPPKVSRRDAHLSFESNIGHFEGR